MFPQKQDSGTPAEQEPQLLGQSGLGQFLVPAQVQRAGLRRLLTDAVEKVAGRSA